MDDDQQFCLRWNNHQSTLISVFDTLLENGTLVDCTLAAEGQFLKAHKVVLSACSPYFASLLSQQYDKHPIFILKDVKFQELRAMMDYMYRGEVNISQDQLAALLKAAESLQIKGLSDSRGGNSSTNAGSGQKSEHNKPLSVPVSTTGKASGISSGYTLEQKRPRHAMGALSIDTQELAGSREGSSSPTSRKRKKIRRRSLDNIMADNHEHSNSSSHSMQINSSTAPSNTSAAAATAVAPSTSSSTSTTSAALLVSGAATGLNVTKKTDNIKDTNVEQDMENDGDDDHTDQHQENNKNIHMKKEQNHKRKSQVVDTDNKDNDMLIEPKSEYDDGNDETVEDLTLDEEELLEDLEQAGPSHGGEGSSQGYAQWQVDRSQDEVFLAAQEAAGQQRDPQGDGFQQRGRSPPSPDDQPCDLRLLKQASYLQELVSIAAAASSSNLPQSASSRPGISFSTGVGGSNYVADIAAAAAAAVSASTSPTSGIQSNLKSIQPPPSHQSSLQRMKFCSPISLESLTLTPTLPANLKLNIDNTSAGGSSGSSGNLLSGTGSGTGGSGWGPFTCPRCGNSYARPHSLNRHIRFECGVEPKFECPICHKKSKHKHNLVLHMRTHQNR